MTSRPEALRRRVGGITASFGLAAALAAWLWPIGFGGRMPVGGDATAFSLGLMARCQRAIRSREWPVWLEDWGFGFPGIAESQIGYYYPPHWLFYGLLPLEAAYALNLVAHLLWAMAGAVFAARVFGASARSSWLAGLVFGLNGFFLVHLPHHWSYTVGAWMPWALGLARLVATGVRPLRAGLILAAVLAIQILPGHFQLAFITQLGVAIVVGAGLCRVAWQPLWAAMRRNHESRPETVVPRVIPRLAAAFLAVLLTIGLSACQWVPTLRLARLAEQDRTYEYLSGFAGSPLHLVNYLAPLLFHRSPLWRPIAWDPFHTSPEEWQPYVGLVPLVLALGAGFGAARTPGGRTLALLSIVGLFLSLGPYVPGFAYYCHLPGFSFFRAPARWSLLTALAVALLSARGLDRLVSGEWRRPARACLAVASVTLALPAALLLIWEARLSEGRTPGPATGVLDAVLSNLPWDDDATSASMETAAYRGSGDLATLAGYARQGWPFDFDGYVNLIDDRWRTYRAELLSSIVAAGSLVVIGLVSARRRIAAVGLVFVAAVDLVALGRHRNLDDGPIVAVARQSPVLARMAELAAGERTIDPLQNLPMAVGVAPVLAYRTLDLPGPRGINAALQSLDRYPDAMAARRLVGASVQVFPPTMQHKYELADRAGGRWESLDDPTLAGWLYGRDLIGRAPPALALATFLIWKSDEQVSCDWLVDASRLEATGGLDGLAILAGGAEPIRANRDGSGTLYQLKPRPNSALLRSRTYEPQWVAESPNDFPTDPGGWPLDSGPALGGWQWSAAAERVRFRYDARAERLGLSISASALVAFFVICAENWRRSRKDGA